MPSYRLPRGTADILPEDQARWAYVEEVAKRLAHRYGYQRIVTPVFEDTRVFTRGVGETTDELGVAWDRGRHAAGRVQPVRQGVSFALQLVSYLVWPAHECP